MKKELKELYFKKCLAKAPKTNEEFRTEAYKIGIAKSSKDRDIKHEFSSFFNATRDKNDQYEVEIDSNLEISGPEDFIRDLEQFILTVFFSKTCFIFQQKKNILKHMNN